MAISDSADYVGKEDRFGELYPEVEQSDMIAITAYYPDTVDIEEVKADLATRLADLTGFGLETGQVSLESQELAEEDWADNWKKYYEPARITHDLTISRRLGQTTRRLPVKELSYFWIRYGFRYGDTRQPR